VHINKDNAGINAYMKLKIKLRLDLKAKVELMKNNKLRGYWKNRKSR